LINCFKYTQNIHCSCVAPYPHFSCSDYTKNTGNEAGYYRDYLSIFLHHGLPFPAACAPRSSRARFPFLITMRRNTYIFPRRRSPVSGISNTYQSIIDPTFKPAREQFFMKNCELKLSGNILTITVDISKDFGRSSSGKSIIIASTEGNVSIPEKDDIKIGLNVYKRT